TATQSFSPIEQNKIAEFLENGGQLFVSGSEIGYDLVEKGNSADKAFYRTYLKAIYVRDDTRVHSAVGTVDGIFANLTITFDNGTHGTYDVDFPDGIQPADGALMNLIYKGVNPNTSGGAGIQYEGIFGNGSKIGKLVYLGFPFETIYPESSRDQVMKAVLEFFQGIATVVEASSGDALPGEFELAQNYPNPFNPSTTIEFTLKNSTPQRVRLTIYNLLGQEVVTLVDEKRPAGSYRVRWDGRDKSGKLVPSGVYLYRLQVGNQIKSRKMSFIR
ncbi:MAG: T9SS C-terminal target domain-containing protein, partial [Calditrichaeota bacterium]